MTTLKSINRIIHTYGRTVSVWYRIDRRYTNTSHQYILQYCRNKQLKIFY